MKFCEVILNGLQVWGGTQFHDRQTDKTDMYPGEKLFLPTLKNLKRK